MFLPPVELCVERVASRRDHGFTDEAATRRMHAVFVGAGVADRYVLSDLPGDASAVADQIESSLVAGELAHHIS